MYHERALIEFERAMTFKLLRVSMKHTQKKAPQQSSTHLADIALDSSHILDIKAPLLVPEAVAEAVVVEEVVMRMTAIFESEQTMIIADDKGMRTCTAYQS